MIRAGRAGLLLVLVTVLVTAASLLVGCARPAAGLPPSGAAALPTPSTTPLPTTAPSTTPAPLSTADPSTTAAPSATATTTPRPTAPSTTASSTTGPASTTAAEASCPYPSSGFDCDFQRRFAAAQAYVAHRPGTVGIVVRDRQTGAVWRNGHAGELVWTASTVKLAMTVDLLLRDRAGTITLTGADRSLVTAMLHSSDDHAADTLWSRWGKDDLATRFPRYGLTSVTFVPGFPRYWGFMKCTPNDLDRLVDYVLTQLPADDRDYVVAQMGTVAANQQWGVWGAGAAAMPGNKDGWSQEQGGWVMNSVGFVGPGHRYTLALMNSLRGQGGYDDGRTTDTEAARIVFAGRFG